MNDPEQRAPSDPSGLRTRPAPCVGLFVGGKGLRMGGVAKGNLKVSSGHSVLERLLHEVRSAWPNARVWLIGDAGAYQHLALPALPDEPSGVGPLGGLVALLHATRDAGCPAALALACDLPFVRAALLQRLWTERPEADLLAPKQDSFWQPLCARYATSIEGTARALVNSRRYSLQRLFQELRGQSAELALDCDELSELTDWDSPDDLAAR